MESRRQVGGSEGPKALVPSSLPCCLPASCLLPSKLAVGHLSRLTHQVAAQVAIDLRAVGPPGGVAAEVRARRGAEDDGDLQLVVAAVVSALKSQFDVDARLAADAQPRQAARGHRIRAVLAAQADVDPARHALDQFA